MQILKDEIRKKIIQSAKNEFLEKGFEKSSMRSIARNSEITVGNLYRYFKNKEKLFEAILAPVMEQIQLLLVTHQKDFILENEEDIEYAVDEGINLISSFFLNYRKELIILLEGSSGTIFEKVKNKIIKFFKNHMLDHIEVYYSKKEKELFGQKLARGMTISFIDGTLEILKITKNQDELVVVMREFIKLYFVGVVELLKKK